MPSPVAVVGLAWDGYDVQRADLDVFLEITEGLNDLPDLRTYVQVIPFRHGQRADSAYANGRPIVLSGHIMGPSGTARTGHRAYTDEVKEAFSPFREAPGVLLATLEDGTQRWISAMPLDLRPVPFGPDASRVSIELIAHNPFWRGTGALVMDSGYFANEGETMDAGGEVIVVPATVFDDTEVLVPGTGPVLDTVVTVFGSSSAAIGVENLTLGVGFTGPTLGSGGRFVVNSGDRIVSLNGSQARNQLSLLAGNRHGEYLRLAPGTNRIRITGQPSEVRLRFEPVYL